MKVLEESITGRPKDSLTAGDLLSATRILAFSVLVTLYCAGCTVLPVRVPNRTEGAYANSSEKADLGFLQAGTLRREEVAKKLWWMDTGVKDDRLFIGRWVSSDLGVTWAAGSRASRSGGWERGWQRQNLIVEFGPEGVLQSFRVLPDKELANELSASLDRISARPLELSPPIELRFDIGHPRASRYATLTLAEDHLQYWEESGEHKHDFRISPSQITNLTLDWAPRDLGGDPDPTYMRQVIHFATKTAVGTKLTLRTDMPTAVVLFKYFAQTHHKTPS